MTIYTVAVLTGCLLGATGLARAAPAVAAKALDGSAEATVELSAPMKDAVALAHAAGGGVGYVGSVLATDEVPAAAEVAIIQPVPVEKMKLGEIVMLVKEGCRGSVACLMARRITDRRGSDVATKRYGHPGTEAGKEGVEASVVGRVAYAVDLRTGRIRDMRRDDRKPISFVEALSRESRKWHYIGDTVRRRPLKT